MGDNDRAYYENRIAVEADRALKAESTDARAVHRQLAKLYRARLENRASFDLRGSEPLSAG